MKNIFYRSLFNHKGAMLVGLAGIADGIVRIISLGHFATYLRFRAQVYAHKNFFRPQEFHHHQGRDEM